MRLMMQKSATSLTLGPSMTCGAASHGAGSVINVHPPAHLLFGPVISGVTRNARWMHKQSQVVSGTQQHANVSQANLRQYRINSRLTSEAAVKPGTASNARALGITTTPADGLYGTPRVTMNGAVTAGAMSVATVPLLLRLGSPTSTSAMRFVRTRTQLTMRTLIAAIPQDACMACQAMRRMMKKATALQQGC